MCYSLGVEKMMSLDPPYGAPVHPTPSIPHPSWSDFHSPYNVHFKNHILQVFCPLYLQSDVAGPLWDPTVTRESFRLSISKSTH